MAGGASASKGMFAPQYLYGDVRYWGDLAQWYWYMNTAVLSGAADPYAYHPDRDIVVYSRGKRPVERFLGIPYTKFKLVADINLPSTEQTPYDAYRHYWRLAAGMEAGAVALLDGYTGQTLPLGRTWANTAPAAPKPDDSKILARRVFGVETWSIATKALTTMYQAPHSVKNPTVEAKFAWCVLASYLCNMCWMSLNIHPAWIPDTMRLYLAGGPDRLTDERLRLILGTPWPKGTRGPFGGFKFDAIPREDTRARGRWPVLYVPGWDNEKPVRWDTFEELLSKKFGAPAPKGMYGVEGALQYVGRFSAFEIPRPLGRFTPRVQWMRKLSFFMPYSAWMGTVFQMDGLLWDDVAKSKAVSPEFSNIMYMWSLFGAPSTGSDPGRSYWDTLAEFKAKRNTIFDNSQGYLSYGLDYYYYYALPLWAQFFGNIANFAELVQCGHAAWQFAQTNAGPGGSAIGASNVFSETTTSKFGLPCGGVGATAPADDFAACAASMTISEYDDLARDDLAAKKKQALMVGAAWLMKIVRAFIQAYQGNIVGLGFTIKDSAQMYNRLEKAAATNKSFSTFVRSVPPPFLRNVAKELNGLGGDSDSTSHRVHPKLNGANNPNVRFSTDPFAQWDWATVKASGAAITRELELIQRSAQGDVSELDNMPQAILYSTQVDTALRNFSAVLGMKLNFTLTGRAEDLEQAVESFDAAPPVLPRGLLLDEPTSKLPAALTVLVALSAGLIIWRKRRRV